MVSSVFKIFCNFRFLNEDSTSLPYNTQKTGDQVKHQPLIDPIYQQTTHFKPHLDAHTTKKVRF